MSDAPIQSTVAHLIPPRFRPDQPQTDGAQRCFDVVLDRSVSITAVTNSAADSLASAARTLARFDHAALPQVHDFIRTADGALIILREPSGLAVQDALVMKASGSIVPALATPASCALTYMQVCAALSAAHTCGVTHPGLTNEHILLGELGQVQVGGWERGLVQPRGASPLSPSSRSDDIRAVGHCLYSAVAGEATPVDQAGRLESVSAVISGRIPADLLAIIRLALASDGATGYDSMDALRQDLVRFLEHHAPQAVGPGWWSRLTGTLVTHARAAALLGSAALVTVAIAVSLHWGSVQTFAAWGPTVVEEHFDEATWNSRWALGPIGSWQLLRQHIISASDQDSYLIFRERLSTPVAIEYTAQMLPQATAGDVSVWWCEGDPLAAPTRSLPWSLPGYFIQAGAYEDSYCAVFRAPSGVRRDYANVQLGKGVEHRIRVEIDEGRIRQWVDGQLTLDSTDIIPSQGGHLALYAYGRGKSFSEVRIWQGAIRTLVSPLTVGDAFYQKGQGGNAAAAYASVAAEHEGSDLGEQARFRQSLALLTAGDRRLAKLIRDSLQDESLRQRAQCLDIDDAAEAGDVDRAVGLFTQFWQTRPAQRGELRQRWRTVAEQFIAREQDLTNRNLDTWYEVRQQCFPDDASSTWLAANMLVRRRRFAEVLTTFPQERRSVAWSLIGLGRSAEVAQSTWAIANERIMAHLAMGQLDRALQSSSLQPYERASVLCAQGRFDDSAAIAPFPALLYTGKAEALLTRPEYANAALVVLGRTAEAAGPGVLTIPGSGKNLHAQVLLGMLDEAEQGGEDVRYYRLLRLLGSGDLDQARIQRTGITGNPNGNQPQRWFAAHAALPLVDEALGQSGALRQALQQGLRSEGTWGGRLVRVAQAVLDPADTTSVAGLPWVNERAAWTCVVEALRGELAGDRVAALAGWSAFRALPITARLLEGHQPNAELEACCTWRLAALKGTP